jgi:LmbE family N-acetylglucosaminyl deacetylase
MTMSDIAALGTILGVWAHPDDEAFLSGGIMAMATDAGSRVVCVTATRGEAGSSDPVRCPPHVMAKKREHELVECLAILGVQEHQWLDHHDGECASVDLDEAATQIAAVIEEVQPDAILTFGPEGFTDHPDHKAISRWVVEAHRRTGGEAARQVHFARQTEAWFDRHGPGWSTSPCSRRDFRP